MLTFESLDGLSQRVLRACGGEIVSLPYNADQDDATRILSRAGLIQGGFDDDQPTFAITRLGRAMLAARALAPKREGETRLDEQGRFLEPGPDYAGGCRADRDHECNWAHCPQLRDGEPHATGRTCPRDDGKDDDA